MIKVIKIIPSLVMLIVGVGIILMLCPAFWPFIL
ncbi:hypothetical protein [Shigella phage ESh19]|uniref:Uncharacterized protein n=1 Tax=Escherichia phage pEC-M719-6WT.1 TaxID=3056220 RepID=A0AA51YF25_9CAUD|nr:hypothetical protein [Shigella phage ESh19]WMU95574.1 hypothetical protein [Escherichia phage pEC-M719-6WT.1]DAJ98459.1 MAG TPA: hypothetical protein [Caudoviricetes sp.]